MALIFKQSTVVIEEGSIEVNCGFNDWDWLVHDDWSEDPRFYASWDGEATAEFELQGAWRFYELVTGDDSDECMSIFFKQAFTDLILLNFPNSKIVAIEFMYKLEYGAGNNIAAFMLLPKSNGCTTYYEDQSCALSARHDVAMLLKESQGVYAGYRRRKFFLPESPYKAKAEDPTAWSTLSRPPIVGIRAMEGSIKAVKFYFEELQRNFWQNNINCEESIA